MSSIIPEQRKGGQSVSTYSVKTANPVAAKKIFESAKLNLLKVNDWHSLAGILSADFQLVNEAGEKITKCAEEGNYFRINIPPAPGPDWVRIEKIEEYQTGDYELTGIRVRPATPPFEKEVTHFFSPDATSTFMVERKGVTVTASVIGRNEVPNTKSRSLLQKIRNILVATAAILGFNKPQWKSLVKGIIRK